jgi:hypothetical protein
MNDLRKYRPEFLKNAMRERIDGTNGTLACLECKAPLPPHLQNYCSGDHMQQAKDNGRYTSDCRAD